MKLRILLTLLFLSTQVVTAETNENYEKFRQQFFGDWKTESEDRVSTVTWMKNGTWKSKTVEGGETLWILEGVWWTLEGRLHGVVLKSSTPGILLGKDQPSEVIEISDSEYTIKNWQGNLKTYVRDAEQEHNGD